MDREQPDRLRSIRAGMTGTYVVLYLDLDERKDDSPDASVTLDELCDVEVAFKALSLSPVASRAIAAAIMALENEDVLDLNDTAGTAVSLFAGLGVDRQAALYALIEAWHETKPLCVDEADQFDGYAEKVSTRKREEYKIFRLAYHEMQCLVSQGARLPEYEGGGRWVIENGEDD